MKSVVSLASAVCALAVAMPSYAFNELPEDKYQVGVTYFNAIDYSRVETFTDRHDDYRDVMVKIWYPAEITPDSFGVHLGYHTDEYPSPAAVIPGAGGGNYEPPQDKSGAYRNAPMVDSDSPLPVIFYSSGYYSHIEDSESVLIDLASQGYVVVSVGHAHQIQFMAQADGGFAAFDWNKRWNDWRLSDRTSMTPDEWNIDIASYAGRDLTQAEIDHVYQMFTLVEGDRKSLQIWVQDMEFALNQLYKVNSGQLGELVNNKPELESLKGQLDLNQFAAFGLSFGGPTAATFCNRQARCLGAANLDGYHYDLSQGNPARKPLLIMYQDYPQPADYHLIFKQQERDTFMVKVKDSRHLDFSDLTLEKDAQSDPEQFGAIDGQRMKAITKATISQFFDTYLKGESDYEAMRDLLEQTPEFSRIDSKKGTY